MADNTALDARFMKFNDLCRNEEAVGIIADLYVNAMGKNNIIDAIYKLVNTTPSTGKVGTGNHPQWEYNATYYVSVEKIGYSKTICIRTMNDSQIIQYLDEKIYNKSGERIYYGRVVGEGDMQPLRPAGIIKRALLTSAVRFRRFIFDELIAAPRSELIAGMKLGLGVVELLPIRYAHYDHIPRDFKITHKDLPDPIFVHKFAAMCFSNLLSTLILGSGSIKGSDTIGMSQFEPATVRWCVEVMYDPRITPGQLDDDQWAILNYLGIDTDAALERACGDLYLI